MEDSKMKDSSIPDIDTYLNLDKYIPHRCHLTNSDERDKKDKKDEKDEKYFINSTLNCLINMKSFLIYLYKFNDIFQSSDYFTILKETVNSIFDKIENADNGNDTSNKDNDRCSFYPKKITELILKKIPLFKEKSNHDPRVLIDFIFNSFLGVNKSNISSLDNTHDYSNNDSNTLISNSLNTTGINIVIKKKIKCPNIKCERNIETLESFSTLHFYLPYGADKEYTIYDCFNDFLEKENQQKEYECKKCSCIFKAESKNIIYQLPEDIIIFIYYNDEEKDYDDFYYKFEEELDFTKYDFIDNNVKNKKYFLSSLIACRYPRTEDEFFYTFCRKNLKSNFLIYYSDFNYLKREVNNVNNKILKLKTDQYDRKRSYPYVLVYKS